MLAVVALAGACAGPVVAQDVVAPAAAAADALPPHAMAADAVTQDVAAEGDALAAAAPPRERLRIDPALTQVQFGLRLVLVRKLSGSFPIVEGEVWLDRAAGTADVDVRIDAREVRMERAAHAEWARSPEFFDSLNHPWIQFRAEDVPLAAFRDGGRMQGEVTLRGITAPVELQLQPSACTEPGRGCPVRASGDIERSAFGMTARRFVLGDNVRLEFEIRVAPADRSSP